MKVILIRHGMTHGNTLSRYIGVTDEPLCPEGLRALEERSYPPAEKIFSSPLLRCLQTAAQIYPHLAPQTEELLAECHFGEFENKNWRELSGNPRYQQWIDSNGTLPFPGGESREAFAERCIRGFEKTVEQCLAEQVTQAAWVVHGGTIMSIMERFAVPSREYYQWSVKNGEGYLAWLEPEKWKDGQKELIRIRPLG